ncbi:MAG: tyrosine-type recombinase/integrase [Halobacteriales archaeon]
MAQADNETEPKFEFLGEAAVDDLNYRQQVTLADHRREFIDWLRNRGKNPTKRVGYAESTVKNYASRYHQIHRWVWESTGTFSLRISRDQADSFVMSLLNDEITRADGSAYSTTSKRKFSDVLKANFRWREDQFGSQGWDPPIEFDDAEPENPADRFTRNEREKLYEASLKYRSVPSYSNLTPDERDRWKAHVSQVLGKPKEDVLPADFADLNQSWKIPSLIGCTLDAGLRPSEINRFDVDWLSLETLEIHVPASDSVKNQEHWKVAIRERTARDLGKWLDQRACKSKYDDSGKVWLNRQANPYTSKTLNSLLDSLLEIAGINDHSRNLVWYSFRKSTGQYLHEVSDQLTTATQLRHSDLDSVRHYATPSTERRRDHLRDIDG